MALVTAIGRYECVASASCALVLVLLLRAKWAALENAHAVVTPPLRVDTTVNVGPAWVTVLVPIWLRDTLGVQSVLLSADGRQVVALSASAGRSVASR